MAVSNYTGWPVGVNTTILDATTISIGENAVKTDELEDGHKISVQRSAYVPERYSVKMSFDWENPDPQTGKTEYQLFTEWYKYRHKCGAVPFEFPKIIYSSNTGIPGFDHLRQEVQYTEYYKITSTTEGSKSGGHVAVTMTWEAVYTGAVSIASPTPHVHGLTASTDYLDVTFDVLGDVAPTTSNFTLYRKTTGNWASISITGFAFDGVSTVRLYHDHYDTGTYTIAISNYEGCVESQGSHTAP